MTNLICKICVSEFSPTHPMHRGGHFSVCGDCEPKRKLENQTNRHIGVLDAIGKTDVRISIVRGASKSLKAMIKRQGLSGPNQCSRSLQLGSPTSRFIDADDPDFER